MFVLFIAATICLSAGQVFSADDADSSPGTEALNKAIQAKLSAKNIDDVSKVIQYCEEALDKGLSKENEQFCNQLLSSALLHRGTVTSEIVFVQLRTGQNWTDLRRIALKDLERSLKIQPDNPPALMLVARLNVLPGGDSDRVDEVLGQIVQSTNSSPLEKTQALVLRAARREDADERMADLDEAVKVAPSEPNAFRARAIEYLSREDYANALEDLKSALKMEPENLVTLDLTAKTLDKLDRKDDAMRIYEQMEVLAPKSLEVLVEKARYQALNEKYSDAIKTLEEADKIAPNNPAVMLLLASVYLESDQVDKALKLVDKVLAINPDLLIALRIRATILASQDSYEEAIEDLNKMHKLIEASGNEEADEETLLQLALLYSVTEQYEKSFALFKEVLDKNPENIIALRGRADAYLSLGKQKEAIADYESVLKVDPEDSGSLNNLSWVLSTSPVDSIRDGKRALELGKKACEVTDYEQAHILSTLAAAYAETGDFEKAREWSAKAVELGTKEDNEQLDSLKNELENYKNNKPWREELPTKEKDVKKDESTVGESE